MSIRLMIVDYHGLFREGIRRILSDTKDIIVVAEASDGETAIVNAKIYNPDIILLDISMPYMNGIDTLRKMKDQGIKSKIIILSGKSNKKNIIDSIKIGADCFLTKDNNSESLIDTIRKLYRGESDFGQSLEKMLSDNIEEELLDDIDVGKIDKLSTREYEILILIAHGYNNKAIGKELYISEKTVKNHITSLFKKLEVEDRVQAVIFVYTNKIL